MSAIEIQIHPVKPTHFEQWQSLYVQYLAFYNTTLTEPELAKVWAWFFNPQEKIYCHVAMHQNQLIGLVHFREYLRPIRANTGVFLDDLFVKQEYRGQQVARALIQNVNDFCKNHEIALIRWITAPDNFEARRLYDKVAIATPWKMYEKTVS